ncbi:MAG: SGNH/GDSL hydrolase family protein [Spirochaetota bacterium]|nr:MAG: SGNH/GDSL hydrolase family protein [Spirochaetota bacterium]
MITVLCYGDSNTYGRDPITKKRLPREVRWPGVLQNMLGNDYYVIEEGLNGRTTVWDDPVRPGYHKRNGSMYLLPCLESHAPIDLCILMLGSNDLKVRYTLTPYDIAESIGHLIEIILKSSCGREDGPPQVLLLAPPPLGKLDEYAETFSGGVEKSKRLPQYYRRVADQYECKFFDTSSVIQSSKVDGLHIDPEDHVILGKAIAQIVIDYFTPKN